MFSNQKRHTSEDEDIVIPASATINKPNISSTDNTDSKSAMIGGFSLQSKPTQGSTGLQFSPP